MKINEAREKLTKLLQVADTALPHIRVGMGTPCGKHPTDLCAACWADAYYSDLKLAMQNVKEIMVQKWEVEA